MCVCVCVRACMFILPYMLGGKKHREDNLSLNITQIELFSMSMADTKISELQKGSVKQGIRRTVRIFRY